MLQQGLGQILVGAAAVICAAAFVTAAGLPSCGTAAPARAPVLPPRRLLLLLTLFLLPLLCRSLLPEGCLLRLLQSELQLICQVSSREPRHAARLLCSCWVACPSIVAACAACTSRCITASCCGGICLALLPLLLVVLQHGCQGGAVGSASCGPLVWRRQQVQQSCLGWLLGVANVQRLPGGVVRRG